MQTKKMTVPFTQVANSIINDPNISFKAKGIYAYIYSKPDGWDFAVRRIAQETAESRDAIESGIKELEDAGYLKREKQPTGRIIYMVLYPPEPSTENPTLVTVEPSTENPKVGKPQGGKTRPISNKFIKKEIEQEKNTSEQSSQEIPEIIKAFESINPACSRYYGNKTQREACQKLIDIHTFERVIKIIQTVLPKSNGLAYVPTITTPLQLLEKYSALESAIKRSQSNYKKENPQFTIVNGVPIKM